MIDTFALRSVLSAHAKRYPLMQPCDAVKLLYQHVFGCGHMVADAEGSLLHLKTEVASVAVDKTLPLYEDIGNGFVRVQLKALDVSAYPLERLNADFVRSAGYKGNMGDFLDALAVLSEQLSSLGFGFSGDALAAYLDAYADSGFPPVSHSDVYRAAYLPAYRVVRAAEVSFGA